MACRESPRNIRRARTSRRPSADGLARRAVPAPRRWLTMSFTFCRPSALKVARRSAWTASRCAALRSPRRSPLRGSGVFERSRSTCITVPVGRFDHRACKSGRSSSITAVRWAADKVARNAFAAVTARAVPSAAVEVCATAAGDDSPSNRARPAARTTRAKVRRFISPHGGESIPIRGASPLGLPHTPQRAAS